MIPTGPVSRGSPVLASSLARPTGSPSTRKSGPVAVTTEPGKPIKRDASDQVPARWHHVFLDQKERAGKAFGEVQGEQIGAAKRQMGGNDPKQQRKPTSRKIEKTDRHAATVSASQASGFGNTPCGDAFQRQENRESVQARAGNERYAGRCLQFCGPVRIWNGHQLIGGLHDYRRCITNQRHLQHSAAIGAAAIRHRRVPLESAIEGSHQTPARSTGAAAQAHQK